MLGGSMIERRSIVLTVVVLAMLFTGMFLYLFTKGELQQARLALEDEEALEGEMPLEEETGASAEESTYEEAVAGVREDAEEEPVDVKPTAATGAAGYVTLVAGLATAMGLFGLIRSWRYQLAQVRSTAG